MSVSAVPRNLDNCDIGDEVLFTVIREVEMVVLAPRGRLVLFKDSKTPLTQADAVRLFVEQHLND